MRFFKKVSGETSQKYAAEKNTVYAPLTGKAVLLEEIDDGVFSAGVLGKGCGIKPESETVMAPFDGTVIQVADTNHAIGMESKDGIQVLIHVGLDTVAMNGRGFNVHVKVGDKIKCGQKLLTFQKKEIAAAGFQDITAVLVLNSSDYKEVEIIKTGSVSAADKLIVIH